MVGVDGVEAVAGVTGVEGSVVLAKGVGVRWMRRMLPYCV